MSGINSTLTPDQRIAFDGSVVKPVDVMTPEDLRQELREMGSAAIENLFGEEIVWITSI